MTQFTQSLLDNIHKQLTHESIKELKAEFMLEHRSSWIRAWKLSPVRGNINLDLIKAAKAKIQNQKSIGQQIIQELNSILEINP